MIASESEPKPGYAHHRGIPYGYAVQRDGSVAADEDEQAVLLRLQLWREAGYSYSVIAASLNAAGFKDASGVRVDQVCLFILSFRLRAIVKAEFPRLSTA